MRSEAWLRMMSIVVLLVVFGAGGIVGAVLVRWGAAPAQHPHSPQGPIEAIERELGLDAEQIATLRVIAASHDEELAKIGRATQSGVRDIVFAIEEELRPRLRPDQVQRLDGWRARRPRNLPGLPGSLGPGRGGREPGGTPELP
jgi:hypothetical protein